MTLNLKYGSPTKYGEAGLTLGSGQTAVPGKLVRMGATGRWVLTGTTGSAAGIIYSLDTDPYTGDTNTLDKIVVLTGPGTIIDTDQFVSAAGLVPGAEVEQAAASGKWAVYSAGKKLGRVLSGGYGYGTVRIITYI